MHTLLTEGWPFSTGEGHLQWSMQLWKGTRGTVEEVGGHLSSRQNQLNQHCEPVR